MAEGCNFTGCTYMANQSIVGSPHEEQHENLRAVAGLILKLNMTGSGSELVKRIIVTDNDRKRSGEC